MTVPARRPTSAQPDRELVAAVASGNLEALGALFERYEPALRRYLGRLGVASGDADDLIQATFLEVVRAARRYDPSYTTRAWLFGIATLMVRRHQRSLGRAAARIAAWARSAHDQREAIRTPAEIVQSDRVLRDVARAFERLSPKKRAVFVLVTLEGLSGEETAAALGIPVNTVWTRLHHARLELRALLGEGER